MSDAGIVQPFGESGQSNRVANYQPAVQVAGETATRPRVPLYKYVRALDKAVCGKVNALNIKYTAGGAWYVSKRNFRLDRKSLRGKSQARAEVMARQVAWYIAYTEKTYSGMVTLHQLGRRYRRDHTTISHGIHKISDRIKDNPLCAEARMVREIRQELQDKFDEEGAL